MKGFVIAVLVAVGGYSVFEWITGQGQHNRRQRTPANATLSAGSVAAAFGMTSPETTVSGVPVFNESAVANGHGDQVAAALHSNRFATIPGTGHYQPAFGPTENQNGGVLPNDPV